jgi:hypothetical protein
MVVKDSSWPTWWLPVYANWSALQYLQTSFNMSGVTPISVRVLEHTESSRRIPHSSQENSET